MSVYEIVAKNFDYAPIKKGTLFYTVAKVIFIAIVINLTISAAYFAEKYIRRSAYFSVNLLHVSGNSLLGSSSIVSASGVKRGQNIFDTDIDYIHRRVTSIPWVKWAKVEKVYPNKISIAIVERRPTAVIKTGISGFIIDDEGVLLSSDIAWKGGSLPVIADINTPLLLKPGDALTDYRIKTAISLIKALQGAGFDREYQIDGRDLMRPVMLLKVPVSSDSIVEKRVTFYKDYIEDSAYNLTALLKGLKGDIENLHTIDLSFKDKAVVVWKEAFSGQLSAVR